MAILVCVLCQPVHSCIELLLHWLQIQKSFYEDLFLLFFDKDLNNLLCVLPMHLWLMHHPCTCALTNGVQQPVHSTPSVFPAKKRKRKSQLCSNQNSNGIKSKEQHCVSFQEGDACGVIGFSKDLSTRCHSFDLIPSSLKKMKKKERK